MKFDMITTERLYLRKIDPAVLTFVFDNYSEQQLLQFFGADAIETLANERAKFAGRRPTPTRSFLYFQLIDRASGSVIGACGYHTWYLDHDRAEIGYGLIDDNFKNKGLMYEALVPIIAYGFDQMSLHRIEAFIGTDNEPSQKLIRKAGFIKDGVLREHYLKDGRMEDSVVFSLLKREFKK